MLTRFLPILLTALTLAPLALQSQAPPLPAIAPEAQAADTAAILAKVTALRDTFVARIHAAGLTCPIAPPKIVMEDIPSFGQYEDETNTLHTSDWYKLTPEEREVFFRIAGPTASEKAARATFEGAAHQWIFIHELGHWWQACQHAISPTEHYAVEYGANRIAAAYWREVDPAFAQKMSDLFTGLYEHSPSPLPTGQPLEKYFNDHYDQLGPTPAYRWYQSQMNAAVFAENPPLTFNQALAKPTK
jgi:hypothetical protein